MFIHIEFQMRLGDYPSMMVLRADFEENELWNKLGLALHEGVFSESSRPNNYIDKVRRCIVWSHPEASWEIQCKDLGGQVWSLSYLRPEGTLEIPRVIAAPVELKSVSRYKREPVI